MVSDFAGLRKIFLKNEKTVMNEEKLRGLAKGVATAMLRAPRRSAAFKAFECLGAAFGRGGQAVAKPS